MTFVYQGHWVGAKVTVAKTCWCPVLAVAFETLDLKTSFFSLQERLPNVWIIFTCQGHMVIVKITGATMRCDLLQMVFLWLKGCLLASVITRNKDKRDKRSLEFYSDSLIDEVISNQLGNYCWELSEFFSSLTSYLIDIRMAKFLENCVTYENYVCRLFAHNALCSLDRIFVSYDDDIVSSCDLRSYVTDMFFERYYTATQINSAWPSLRG